MESVTIWQWTLIIVTSLLFFWFSPLAKTTNQFFKATQNKRQPSAWMLTGSLIISWIFAKSITNAANLGASFGIVGAKGLCENDHVRLALQTQEPIYVELPEGLSMNAGIVEFQPREVAFIPLIVQSMATGVVVLAGSTAFERDSRSLSQIFARTFVVALSNAMTHDDLQRIAALDPLTSCYNRRFGLARLREEYKRATRSDTPLGLIMFDIDHFKLVNDTHGHLIGDRILTKVAQLAGQHLREGDVLVRYGGEEFLCILPGAEIEGAADVCERIRSAVEALVVRDRDKEISCTVSLGYGSFPEMHADDETALIGLADEALYRAKSDGRNRSVRICQHSEVA